MTTTCIAAHDDDPPLALPGLRLCQRHHGRLARDLTDIVTCWSLLAELHEPGRGTGGGHGKHADPPAPVNLDVADITDPRTSQVIAAMGWARIVVEDRRLAVLPSDVAECAGLLTRHLEWVAAQDWADEACDEISAAARTLRWATGDNPDAPLGTCPDIDPRGEQDRCGGPLRWVEGTTAVRCGRCGSHWAEADLPHILRVVQPTRRFPVERDWVCWRYGVTDGQLRTWVWRGQVRTFGDRQVDLFDVLQRITGG